VTRPRVIQLGRMAYPEALALQREHVEAVIAARGEGATDPGRVLVVEHDPVITVSRRRGAEAHVLADGARLRAAGVALEPTDRGGDVTYHGPGQVVVYPILDLNALHLRLHEYMRVLEQAVIDALGRWGVRGVRDPEATGVWVERPRPDGAPELAKVAAMGVRVRRWVSMHGLALNVRPDLGHFGLIVPCGLAGRPVTSMAELLGAGCPEPEEAAAAVVGALTSLLPE
jgi:lipoyl(octanoyl) transferase